jgi:hypothetical protein
MRPLWDKINNKVSILRSAQGVGVELNVTEATDQFKIYLPDYGLPAFNRVTLMHGSQGGLMAAYNTQMLFGYAPRGFNSGVYAFGFFNNGISFGNSLSIAQPFAKFENTSGFTATPMNAMYLFPSTFTRNPGDTTTFVKEYLFFENIAARINAP